MTESRNPVKSIWQAWWLHATFTVFKLLLVTGAIVALAGVIIPNASKNFGG
jgi:hypothetical protein